MERKQIGANVCVASIGIIFVAVMMWLRPDKTLDFLITSASGVLGATAILWAAKVDRRKDERTIQLMTLASRNAMFFLVFLMPMLAGFSIAGIIVIDTFWALMLLWAIAIGIVWASFFYYYTR
jgi:uncharacterized membrane protein YadS